MDTVVDAETRLLPSLPEGLLSPNDRLQAYLQAKGHALPAADYALWVFLVVTSVAWVPVLGGWRGDVDAALRWQLAAIPLSLGVRRLVDLANGLARQNAVRALRADVRARGSLSNDQLDEYRRRGLVIEAQAH